MSLPTQGEEFAKLIEHLRLAQEAAAMLAHLTNSHNVRATTLGQGWLAVSENLKKMQHIVTKMAVSKMQ